MAGYRRCGVECVAMIDYHNGPIAMARVLVQYMPSNLAVQREIEASLGVKLHLSAIGRLRATYHDFKEHRSVRGFDASVVWRDERYQQDMHEANQEFVQALINAKVAA
jgi:hypothetical protein